MKYTNRFDIDVASTIAFKHLFVNGQKCCRLGHSLTDGGNVRPNKFVAYFDDGGCCVVTKDGLLNLCRQNGIKTVSKGVKSNGEMTVYVVPEK